MIVFAYHQAEWSAGPRALDHVLLEALKGETEMDKNHKVMGLD